MWLAVAERLNNQSTLADDLGAPAGQVSHWLYGDRLPGLRWAFVIRDKLGIDPSLWGAPPVEPFALPAKAA